MEQEDNRFSNVRAKLRNPNLGDEKAWEEAQPLFGFYLEDYPEKYTPHLPAIRSVFDLRRNAFLGKTLKLGVSNNVIAIYDNLSPNDQDLLGNIFGCIREIFEIPTPSRKLRSR